MLTINDFWWHKHLLFELFCFHFVINIVAQFFLLCLFNFGILTKSALDKLIALIPELLPHILCQDGFHCVCHKVSKPSQFGALLSHILVARETWSLHLYVDIMKLSAFTFLNKFFGVFEPVTNCFVQGCFVAAKFDWCWLAAFSKFHFTVSAWFFRIISHLFFKFLDGAFLVLLMSKLNVSLMMVVGQIVFSFNKFIISPFLVFT